MSDTPRLPLQLRRAVVDSVLDTDMRHHHTVVRRVQKLLHARPLFRASTDDRQLLRSCLLKAADISNVVRPFEVARSWAAVSRATAHQLPPLLCEAASECMLTARLRCSARR